VVSTPQAVSALQVRAGQDVLVGDTPETMAQASISLLTDENLRQRLGQAGRYYVELHHDWNKAAEKLEGIYHEASTEKQSIPA
jgi:glycosyltransferase involved in cell wall biosynthesis